MEDLTETVAWRLFNASSSELPERVKELQLVIDVKRSQAAEAFAKLLKLKLRQDGYLVVDGIDDTLETYLEDLIDKPPDEQLEIELRQLDQEC